MVNEEPFSQDIAPLFLELGGDRLGALVRAVCAAFGRWLSRFGDAGFLELGARLGLRLADGG